MIRYTTTLAAFLLGMLVANLAGEHWVPAGINAATIALLFAAHHCFPVGEEEARRG